MSITPGIFKQHPTNCRTKQVAPGSLAYLDEIVSEGQWPGVETDERGMSPILVTLERREMRTKRHEKCRVLFSPNLEAT